MEIHIRPAKLDDASAISSLGATVYTATFGHSVTREQLQRYLDGAYSEAAIQADLRNPSKATIVAVDPQDASHIIGFCVLHRDSSASEPCLAGVDGPVELQRLYVGLDQQGRGVGRTLVGAVEAIARSEGFVHIWLGVWEFNTVAQKVYHNLGYRRRIGEHIFDFGGDLQTDWILLKKL